MNQALPRRRRLRSRKVIGELFDGGASFSRKPLRCVYQAIELESAAMMVSVPKRLFKRAVDRNLIKRRIREAYRRNYGVMGQEQGFRVAILYTAPTIADYSVVERSLVAIFEQISAHSK